LALCAQGKVAYSADELSAYRVHGESMSISAKGISEGMREHLLGVKNAFARMKDAPGVTNALYEKAIKRGLTAAATDYIFGSHLRQGWYAYWCGVRINPLWTIFQTRTLILIMRTLLGPRYFDRARSLLKRQA
jgi:hypothetical protein